MELADKHEIHQFLSVEPVGDLFQKLAIEIVARESNIMNLGDKDPKVVAQALEMFTTWLGEMTGAQNDFLNQVEIEETRQKNIDNYIYKT